MLKIGLKMKKRISENMVIQTIRECLLSVPFLQLGNISIDENALNPDFKMEVRIKNKSLKILAEYKDNGQPRVARLSNKRLVGTGRCGVWSFYSSLYISRYCYDM